MDLTGFTQTSRSQIVALRPAPINVSWLGFPGGMGELNGQPLFDYLLSDAFVTPPETSCHYAEKLALLPHTYQPNDTQRPLAASKGREAYGLPEQGFVFFCFYQIEILIKVIVLHSNFAAGGFQNINKIEHVCFLIHFDLTQVALTRFTRDTVFFFKHFHLGNGVGRKKDQCQ